MTVRERHRPGSQSRCCINFQPYLGFQAHRREEFGLGPLPLPTMPVDGTLQNAALAAFFAPLAPLANVSGRCA